MARQKEPAPIPFTGFDAPIYFIVADDFVDRWLPRLNGTETKVFLVLCRKSRQGMRKGGVALSDDEFVYLGLRPAKIGQALAALRDLGLIQIRDGGSFAPTYFVSGLHDAE